MDENNVRWRSRILNGRASAVLETIREMENEIAQLRRLVECNEETKNARILIAHLRSENQRLRSENKLLKYERDSLRGLDIDEQGYFDTLCIGALTPLSIRSWHGTNTPVTSPQKVLNRTPSSAVRHLQYHTPPQTPVRGASPDQVSLSPLPLPLPSPPPLPLPLPAAAAAAAAAPTTEPAVASSRWRYRNGDKSGSGPANAHLHWTLDEWRSLLTASRELLNTEIPDAFGNFGFNDGVTPDVKRLQAIADRLQSRFSRTPTAIRKKLMDWWVYGFNGPANLRKKKHQLAD